MTDITATAPIKFPAARLVRVLRLLRPRNPAPEIGRAITTTSQAYGAAIALAYVAPWANLPKHQQQPAPEEDLQGRDPNW